MKGRQKGCRNADKYSKKPCDSGSCDSCAGGWGGGFLSYRRERAEDTQDRQYRSGQDQDFRAGEYGAESIAPGRGRFQDTVLL